MPLSFTVPTAVGGKLPVPVTCSAQPGAAFPVGSTIVTCTATDALGRQASCNFNVTVTVTPRISKTRFLAFGDSITFGRCGPKEPLPNTCPPYTARLGELLRARYTQQTFVIATSGIGGERATEGEDRLPGELATYNPEVLLLMEGTNDMLSNPLEEDEALESLEDMVNAGINRGIRVFLATLPPILPRGPNDFAVDRVVRFNAEIRDLAARKGISLVEVFGALNADLNRYYTIDDVHPNNNGLRLIGETFYAAIRSTLDTTPAGGSFSPAATRTGLFELPGRLTPGPTATPGSPMSRRPVRRR